MQLILDDINLTISRAEPVHGGDINQCYCLFADNKKYFLKINDARKYPDMFRLEADGLNALRKNFSLSVPAVLKTGEVNHQQYLLLEWMKSGRPANDFWERFGRALAMMHKTPQLFFGWETDNYIGSLKQINSKQNSWDEFYRDCRIMPLVRMLADTGQFLKKDIIAAGNFCKEAGKVFPAEPPALLHGDLWSGNFMSNAEGNACMYDPAVYNGHREMDLGMTRLFDGFDNRFYEAYSEVYPLEKDWARRLSLTQLYPLLVHAVLFGGNYVHQARSIMKGFSTT